MTRQRLVDCEFCDGKVLVEMDDVVNLNRNEVLTLLSALPDDIEIGSDLYFLRDKLIRSI